MTVKALFRAVLELTVNGSWVILALLLLRPLLGRFPKRYRFSLWAVAAFRLLCPVSFSSVLSLFKLPHVQTGSVVIRNALPAQQSVVMNTSGTAAPPVQIGAAPAAVDIMLVLSALWLLGIAALVVYAAACHLRLRTGLRTAIQVEKGIYESDRVSAPFILGLFPGRIYLPAGMDAEEREQVLAHEKHHLKRLDPVWKMLGFAVLTLHWFNPLCHVAFWLFGRDMEMSCDEAVLKTVDRHDYCTALVGAASGQKMSAPGPLAFGETAVKSRVKNILRWRPAAAWTVAVAAVLCVALVLVLAADPRGADVPADGKYIIANGQTGEDYDIGALVKIEDGKLYLANEVHDLSDKSWQTPPFNGEQWQRMLQCLEGAAPETLDGCRYMELFVLRTDTMAEYLDSVFYDVLDRPVQASDMGSAVRTIFLLEQEGTIFVCSFYESEPAGTDVFNIRQFSSDRLVEPGSALDPTVETFAHLDAQLEKVLSREGGSVQEKAEADEALYWSILRHRHIMEYLCHVMMTEGLADDKGELVGILFEDILMRRFEEPLIPRGDMTAAQYFECYMAYAQDYYTRESLVYATKNASGPMLAYLTEYYGYGK